MTTAAATASSGRSTPPAATGMRSPAIDGRCAVVVDPPPSPPPSPSSSSSLLDAYLASIAPPRELVCPITQELLVDPVVAEDGHTYERRSLATWFGMGRDRSPVTNSLLSSSSSSSSSSSASSASASASVVALPPTSSAGDVGAGDDRAGPPSSAAPGGGGGGSMVPNLAIASMANAHRERLGRELVALCGRASSIIVVGDDDGDDDGGDDEGGEAEAAAAAAVGSSSWWTAVRVEGLLDAGADPNVRDGGGSNTPLHLLIRSGNVRLANRLLDHDASVALTNDSGLDCIAAAEEEYARRIRSSRARRWRRRREDAAETTMSEWTDFIRELKRRGALERARDLARDLARSRANEEHRERQRTLAANARSDANDVDGGGNHPGGLGRMGEGVGYVPSLAALQFQSSVPGPSPSVAEYENGERERLDRILWGMGIFALAYFLIS